MRDLRRLDWLEIGRGIAALAVTISHLDLWTSGWRWGGQLYKLPPLGTWGVEYFFVLSGFIIYYAHRADIGEPAAVTRYAWRRLVRIFPSYYIILAVALVYDQTLRNISYRADLTPIFLLRQIFLLPGTGLFIGTAWTLRHELLFYAFFALAVRFGRWGLAVFGLWMAAVLANFLLLTGLPPIEAHDPVGILLYQCNLDFAIGLSLAVAFQRGQAGRALAVTTGLAAVLGLILWCGPGFEQPSKIGIIFDKAVFASILGLAVLLSVRRVPAPPALVSLGASSYALYLIHLILGIAIYGAFKHLGLLPALPGLCLPVALAVILAASVAFHRLIEKPILRRLYGVSWARRPS